MYRNSDSYGLCGLDAFDTEQLLECLEKLKANLPIQIPVYDFKRHQRCSDQSRKVNCSCWVILDLTFGVRRAKNACFAPEVELF